MGLRSPAADLQQSGGLRFVRCGDDGRVAGQGSVSEPASTGVYCRPGLTRLARFPLSGRVVEASDLQFAPDRLTSV